MVMSLPWATRPPAGSFQEALNRRLEGSGRARMQHLDPPEEPRGRWQTGESHLQIEKLYRNNPAMGAEDVSTRRRSVTPAVREAIAEASRKFGVSSQVLERFAQVESNFNPRAVSPSGGHRGLFQLSNDIFDRFGSGDIFNPRDNAFAAAAHLRDNATRFERSFGRAATPSDLYMIHQQGFGGYSQHLRNPDAPAWQNMLATGEGRQKGPGWAQRAISGNLPPNLRGRVDPTTLTSADFVAGWSTSFRPGETSPSPSSDPQARTPQLPTGGTDPAEATRRMMRNADTPDPFGGAQAGTENPISPVSPAPSPVQRPAPVERPSPAPPGSMENPTRGRPRLGRMLIESLIGQMPQAPPSTDEWLQSRFPAFGQLFSGSSGGANFSVGGLPGAGGWASNAFNPGPM